jgi:hypothetical protein
MSIRYGEMMSTLANTKVGDRIRIPVDRDKMVQWAIGPGNTLVEGVVIAMDPVVAPQKDVDDRLIALPDGSIVGMYSGLRNPNTTDVVSENYSNWGTVIANKERFQFATSIRSRVQCEILPPKAEEPEGSLFGVMVGAAIGSVVAAVAKQKVALPIEVVRVLPPPDADVAIEADTPAIEATIG